MPSFRFRYSASCISFHPRRLASQWLPPRLSLPPCGLRPFPLGFRFRFWLFGFWITPLSRYLPLASHLLVPTRTWIYYHTFFDLSTTFLNFYNYFLSTIFTPSKQEVEDKIAPAFMIFEEHHFFTFQCGGRTRFNQGSAPSSRRRRRSSAPHLVWFESHSLRSKKKKRPPVWVVFLFLVAEAGLEPTTSGLLGVENPNFRNFLCHYFALFQLFYRLLSTNLK